MLAARKRSSEEFITASIAGASTVSSAPNVITAAGAGDATKVTGETVDLLNYSSATLLIPWFVSLTADKTLTFAAEYQTSADASTWATAVELFAATTVATATGASKGVVQTALDTGALPRYIRFNITPNLSHSGTDVAVYCAVVVKGGSNYVPAA
jgi:hypothetical protein